MGRLYDKIARRMAAYLDRGVYRPGDRLPGLRRLAEQFDVSMATMIEACRRLEDAGRLEARPRSGYFVRVPLRRAIAAPVESRPPRRPASVTGQGLALHLSCAGSEPGVVPLGAAVPDARFLPSTAIARALRVAARKLAHTAHGYALPPGNHELRRQLARKMAGLGCDVSPDEVVITNGCQEALHLALRAVTRAGDVVAVESPVFYGLLQVLDMLGLKALEIPTDPEEGVSLEALRLAVEQWPVRACVVIANYSNPLGYCMRDARKRELVSMLVARDIPLIEDDVYGDLGHGHRRPSVAKAFDTAGSVLYCSSFSKVLAPGLRVGWMVPGRYLDSVEYLKFVSNLGTATIPQLAIAEYLSKGGYTRHLSRIRPEYERAVTRMRDAVGRHFPAGTRVTEPRGGYVVWVELPGNIDTAELARRALKKGVSVMPGQLFSATQKYRNCLRLNCACVWDERTEGALATLGGVIDELSRGGS